MQVSWIDPQDVAALAENLRRAPQPPPASVSESACAILAESDMDALRNAFVGMELEEEDAQQESPHFHAEFSANEPHDLDEPEAEAAYADEPVESFEEHVGPQPNLAAFRQRLQAIRDRAVGAGLLPAAQPAPTSPAAVDAAPEEWLFDALPGTVEERLDAYAEWAYRHLDGVEILIVDDHGDLLWGRHARPELILSTLMAKNAASRSSPASACGLPRTIRHTLAAGNILTVIPCETRLGVIQIAVGAAAGLPDWTAERLQNALIAAMDEQD